MKVSELIQALETFDGNAEVHFSYNFGDHWRTKVAPAVDYVEEHEVVYSDYHSMPRLVDDEEELNKRLEPKSVVVLFS